MNIWVSEYAKKEHKVFNYIKFPATFHINQNGVTELDLSYDAYLYSSHLADEFQIEELLKAGKKVILSIFHGDGVRLVNRDLLKYENFIVLTAARDGNPINILDFPNVHLNMMLPLAYFYVLFAVGLYDYKEIPFEKQYKCGLWHTPEYRHDRDHLIKEIGNIDKNNSLFKIINQKNTEMFDLFMVNNELDASYKFWHCQYFNFLDCETFLSFESASPYSVPFFCSDKIMKGFIMEKIGIPTFHIAHQTILDELTKLGFQVNGFNEYSDKVLKTIINSNTEELREKARIASNFDKLKDMIEGDYLRNYLMNIIL